MLDEDALERDLIAQERRVDDLRHAIRDLDFRTWSMMPAIVAATLAGMAVMEPIGLLIPLAALAAAGLVIRDVGGRDV